MQRMKNREKTRVKRLSQGAAQQPSLNTAPSNEKGDQLAKLLFFGVETLAVVLLVGGVTFCAMTMNKALTASPIEWTTVVWMTVTLALTLLIARSLVWGGVLGAVLLASKMGAWKSQEETCRRALKLRPLLPSGASWASLVLTQSLVSRGQFKEGIAIAEQEWEKNGGSDKADQTMGPTCAAAAYGHQLENDMAGTLTWNDRAIVALERGLANMEKPKTGLLAKAMSSQSGQWLPQFRLQLGAAYFGNANIYFNKQNFRQAKENYKKALEYIVQSPDSNEKNEMMKVAKEQLSRLKHS